MFYFILLSMLHTMMSAQKHDNIWLFGYESNPSNLEFGGSLLDFSNDTIETFYEFRDMNIDVTNSSTCDMSGNLLFYTNGIYIANVLNDTMQNGGGINPGEYANDHAFYGYRSPQAAIILNFFDSPLFYLLHKSLDYPNDSIGFHSPILYYSVINMDLDNGLGAVVEKNQIILDTTMGSGGLTATKHANGRDWWVLSNLHDQNTFYRILITPNEIINYDIQEIGDPILNGIVQSVFSPNGNKYIVYSLDNLITGNYLNIYDFDRCKGELSNPVYENIIDQAYSGGVAISPNSRYLYVTSFDYIYQYDLFADDIIASKDTVAIYDGYEVEVNPFFKMPTRFFLAQLGPDGKIYISCPGGPNVLHVINQPDSAGIACQVLQHHVQLPTYNSSSIPNFPNYRLGSLEGSPCDTLGNTTSATSPNLDTPSIRIFPNPTSDSFTLSSSNILQKEANLFIYDLMGKVVTTHRLPAGLSDVTIDASVLKSGVYFCKLDNGMMQDEQLIKLIIQR